MVNDAIYKRLFSFRRLVVDLLRAVGHPDWPARPKSFVQRLITTDSAALTRRTLPFRHT